MNPCPDRLVACGHLDSHGAAKARRYRGAPFRIWNCARAGDANAMSESMIMSVDSRKNAAITRACGAGGRCTSP